ncbi:hypothetical protein Dimus_029163 [Dionaea muscipula]
MAEALSPGVSDGRGCEEEQGPSMGSSTLPDGDGLELMVANSPEHSSVAVVSVGSPEMKDVDGEKLLEVVMGTDKILSAPCFVGDATEVRGRGTEVGQSSLVSATSDSDGVPAKGDVGAEVSIPQPTQFAGIQGAGSEVRGCGMEIALSPVVSGHSVASGGQMLGVGVAAEIAGGLGKFVGPNSIIDSDVPMLLAVSVSPPLLADNNGDVVTVKSVCGDTMVVNVMVSEE